MNPILDAIVPTLAGHQGFPAEALEQKETKGTKIILSSLPSLPSVRPNAGGHYGFTAKELDFILNYDIKYRLGRDTGNEEE
jgi:hypothetical protein